MKYEPFIESGYRLLHDGTEELARVEAAGIRIDLPRLQKTKKELTEKLRGAKDELHKDLLYKKWRRRFGDKSNLKARSQLKYILYQELGIEVTKTTESGEESTDDEVLQSINIPFTQNLAAYYRYDKTLGTFLKGIEWEIVGDRLHPNFSLDTARTMRSSSSNPNFQNFPVRNKEMYELIRSLFIASRGCVLGENDFKGIEVGVSACYHKDPVFLKYLVTGDMHRDMAAQIYKLKPEQVSKDTRYGAKNKFVFPQFYGDYYVACAKNLWEWIDKGKLKIEGTDVSLKKHLAENGIKRLGACDPSVKPVPHTFEHWLKEVENDFWNRRFMVYGQWRKDFYADYVENGYFEILSGFRIRGVYSKNQVTNAPVQGAAFHCLLWCLIQINRTLRKYRMKSQVVGQIHDSMLGDIPTGELHDYLEIADNIVRNKLPKHFKWLGILPKGLEIEFEICPPGEPWSAKREYKFEIQRGYRHPDPKRDIWTHDTDKFLYAMKHWKAPEKKDRPPVSVERPNHRSNHEVKKI